MLLKIDFVLSDHIEKNAEKQSFSCTFSHLELKLNCEWQVMKSDTHDNLIVLGILNFFCVCFIFLINFIFFLDFIWANTQMGILTKVLNYLNNYLKNCGNVNLDKNYEMVNSDQIYGMAYLEQNFRIVKLEKR